MLWTSGLFLKKSANESMQRAQKSNKGVKEGGPTRNIPEMVWDTISCARNPPERSSCEIFRRAWRKMRRNFGEIFRRFSSFNFQGKWLLLTQCLLLIQCLLLMDCCLDCSIEYCCHSLDWGGHLMGLLLLLPSA